MGKANVILVLVFLSFVSVAAPPVPRGRPRLNASRTTFVAENGNLLRGAVIRHDRAALEAAKAHGLNAVHDYAEGCDLKYPAEGSRAPGYRVETIDREILYAKIRPLLKDDRLFELYKRMVENSTTKTGLGLGS